MRVSPRPEAVGEPEEVDFVDGAQRFGHRALDDLVLQGRHAERTPPAIGFWDVNTPDRLWPVAPGVDPAAEVLKVGLQILLVVRHRDPVDSRACLPLLSPERPFERLGIDVMQQGGEPGLDGRAGRRVHPRKVGWQGDPALCPDPPLLVRNPSGLGPTLHTSRFHRRLHWYYEPVRLPTSARTAAQALPRLRPARDQSGGPGRAPHVPTTACSCVIRPSTPAKRRLLPQRRRTCCLRGWETCRPSRSSTFRGSFPRPA